MMRFKSILSVIPFALVLLVFTSMAPLAASLDDDPCFCETSHEFNTFQLSGCRVGITLDLSPTPSNPKATAGCFIDQVTWSADGGATVTTIGGNGNIAVLEAPDSGTYEVCVDVQVIGQDGQCTETFCIDVTVDC